MAAAKLLVADPDATVVDDGATVWAVSATPDPGVREAIEDGADFETVRSLLCDSPGEYSLIQLSVGASPTIRAHRGVTSTYEVFYLRGSDGDVVVTDQFKNALAALDVGDRTVSRDAVVDHLLYRTTPVDSYVEEVGRLGHGETLRWELGSDEQTVDQHERLTRPERIDADAAVDRLDDVLDRVTPEADCVNMLSGGVDSTLLQEYLPPEAPSTSGAFETPEIEHEVEYAREASDLLGTDHEIQSAPESAFGDRLAETIDALGMPPQQIQTPTLDLAFRADGYDRYVNGMLSDSLFGMGAATARKVWLTRALRFLPNLTDTLETHEKRARKLLREPDDSFGAALGFSQYLPLETVADFAGTGRIEERLRARYEYTASRVPLATDGSRYARHMDHGHWIEFFCENTVTDYRQVAQARGSSFVTPFATTAAAELALAVPTPERYVSGFENKHIPKRLLGRKLPAYDTGKPKGNGHLPEYRYLTDGPLAPALDRYDLPGFVPHDSWTEVVEQSGGLGWVLLSYAIWRDRVLQSPDLDLAPATREVGVSAVTSQ